MTALALWTCCRCEQPIDLAHDGEPHSDAATGDDVHDRCCASCHPHLAANYGIEVDATTDDMRDALESVTGTRPSRRDDGRLTIQGHGDGMTQDQAARGEAAMAARRTREPAA